MGTMTASCIKASNCAALLKQPEDMCFFPRRCVQYLILDLCHSNLTSGKWSFCFNLHKSSGKWWKMSKQKKIPWEQIEITLNNQTDVWLFVLSPAPATEADQAWVQIWKATRNLGRTLTVYSKKSHKILTTNTKRSRKINHLAKIKQSDTIIHNMYTDRDPYPSSKQQLMPSQPRTWEVQAPEAELPAAVAWTSSCLVGKGLTELVACRWGKTCFQWERYKQ